MTDVRFPCTHDPGRSRVAQALVERHAPGDGRAEPAGQQARREGAWCTVVEAMRDGTAAAGTAVAEDLDAPVRSSVTTLVHRDARERLRPGAPTTAG